MRYQRQYGRAAISHQKFKLKTELMTESEGNNVAPQTGSLASRNRRMDKILLLNSAYQPSFRIKVLSRRAKGTKLGRIYRQIAGGFATTL